MHWSKEGSINLFVSVVFATFLLILASLSSFAVASTNSYSTLIGSVTPTTSTGRLDDKDLGNLPLTTQTAEISFTATPSPTMMQSNNNILTNTVTPTNNWISSPTFTPTPFSTQSDGIISVAKLFSYFPFQSNEIFVPTPTPIPTYTRTPTVTPTSTPTPTSPAPVNILYCDDNTSPINIPDDDINGINDEISISDNRLVVDVSPYINISHSWVGDLVVTLTNQNTGESVTLVDRPGVPNSANGCSNNDIIAILNDGAAQSIENKCAFAPRAISGIYLPNQALNTFSGNSVTGIWKLNVSDRYPSDIGTLNHWCLQARISDVMPSPTPTPTPANLPSSAYVFGMSGQDQQLPLDCESRSAVDWAKHYGFTIDEFQFLYALPVSDDPEAGFVGNPDGVWGNIPPNDYGVHALPISLQLQEYGVPATSYRSFRWDDLRAEIASGNPAIVWIIGGSSYSLVNGIPYFYTASSTGNTTIVAPYEHTVILVGYSPTDVTVLNGSRLIDVPLDQFLDSWSVLQFQAVLARP